MPIEKIRIEMLPAGNGDAIFLHLGEQVWLIDSGYVQQTYREAILPCLEALNTAGKHLSKLIITHIDCDHISGAIELLAQNGAADRPKIIPIHEIWHNSYRHLQWTNKGGGTLSEDDRSELYQGTPTSTLSVDTDKDEERVSARQGSSLAGHIHGKGYPWNTDFMGDAIVTEALQTKDLGNGIQFTLLSPDAKALEKLAKKWRRGLIKLGYEGELNEDVYFDDALEFMMTAEEEEEEERQRVSASSDWIKSTIGKRAAHKEDKSATNGSSIAFLLEYAGKKLLFLGDALPSLIVDQLKKLAALRGLEISPEKPFQVDVLKLSHHGGFSNNSPDLLELVAAKHYLISTNGKRHQHPHMETLAWLIHCHRNQPRRLYFNYHHNLKSYGGSDHQKDLKKIMDPDLQKLYKYEVVLPKKDKDGYQLLEL